MASAKVIAVAQDAKHAFSKHLAEEVRLLAGLGIEGDAHQGVTVRHRSRVAQDPTQPNLRQVHLIHAELFEELETKGFRVGPGELGENVTTRGIDLCPAQGHAAPAWARGGAGGDGASATPAPRSSGSSRASWRPSWVAARMAR